MNPGLGHLTPDRWARLREVLDAALELPDGERPAALDRLCGGDAALRADAEALLAADRDAEARAAEAADAPLLRSGGAWAEIGPGAASIAAAPAGVPIEGRRVGPWSLRRELGRGGMGAVYLAERADGGFEQKAAVKVLARDLGAPDLAERFQRERQILARLEHPRIARLLDGGVTESGEPWFAMEAVDGVPITEFAGERDPALRPLLELFLQVCDAVQYAHQQLVVHRDLKPTNVLVAADGGVKLLDFGIARIVADSPEAEPERREKTLRLMTPLYAAPEQIRGEPPTTATDVYALGLLLYELLAGDRPYRPKTAAIGDLERAILEEEPEPPSARARRAEKTRGPARRAGRLRGDLDGIVLTALRKEPARRYATVEAFAADVRRHLDGVPVRARGRSFGYVASTFLRRHRVAAAATVALLATLVAGLAATAWQARVAARERDQARLAAARATELKNFALGLFAKADPLQARGDTITVREVLEAGAARVEQELRGQPAVQAEMWELLGGVYKSLGRFDRAIPLQRRALETRRRLRAGPDSSVASTLLALGRTYLEAEELPAAEPPLREALAMSRRIPDGSRLAANAMGELAVLASRAGRDAEAESLYLAVLRLDSLSVGPRHPDAATDLQNYGMYLYGLGRYADARAPLGRALDLRVALYGRDHPETATTMDDVASALVGLGEYAPAESLRREALDVRRRWFGPEHPDVAYSLQHLGSLFEQTGRYAEAAPLLEEALRVRRKLLGERHADVARGENDMAILYVRMGNHAEAERRFRAALGIWRERMGPDHPSTLTMENNLAVTQREQGKLAEAERTMRSVLARRLKALGAEHADVAASYHHLGIVHRLRGRPAAAEEALRRALDLRRRLLAPDHPKVAETLAVLAAALGDRGRHDEGARLADEAIGICRASFETANAATADALVAKGRILLASGHSLQAEPFLAEALGVRRTAFGDADPRTAEAAVALGLAYANLLKREAADSTLRAALPVLARKPGPPDPLLASGRRALEGGPLP